MPTYPATTVKYSITDGTTTVDLYDTSVDGFSAVDVGFGKASFSPASQDADVVSESQPAFAEKLSLYLKDTSQDGSIATLKLLISLLRDAELYFRQPQKNKPVYLIVKAYNETNERFALVYGSSGIENVNLITSRPFRQAYIIGPLEMTIRRSVWRDGIPGALGSAKTLAQVTGGAASPTESVIANHFDDHSISHIFVYDASGASYSANQYGVTTEWSMFPAAPAVGDIIYYGSDTPFFNLTHNIQQVEVSVGVTYVWEYSNGAAGWPDCALGDDLTLYPYTDFKTAGMMAVNFKGNSAWAVETVNAVANKFWLRCRIDAIATSYTTPPSNKDNAVYNQRAPYVAIPSATVIGDGPPVCLLRMKAPYGGDADVYFSNTSRILVGRKSRNLTSFSSHLNCGNDGMPTGWADTYGTDSSAVADPTAPGGDHAAVSFATNATLIKRITLTGTDLAAAFAGEYRPFLRVAQIGGTAGDCTVKLRVVLDSTATYATGISGPEVVLKGTSTDGGYFELVDMWPNESLSIPFSRFLNADSLTNADLIFEVYASRSTGASTMRIYDLILLPVDEWAAEFDDPVTDITTGSSALRGLTLLDDDAGVIADRTMKSVLSAAGGTVWPAETWSRHGLPLKLDPGKDQRLYFVMCHYPEGENWQTPPMCARTGMMLVVSLYSHNIYLDGRGAT